MKIEELVRILDEKGLQPVPCGDGWKARCPAHDDTNPSFSIWRDRNGRVHLRCHAGCTAADVLKVLGISTDDLHEPELVYQYRGDAGEPLFQKVRKPGKKFFQRRPAPDGSGWIYNLQKGWYRKIDENWKICPGHQSPDSKPFDDAMWVNATPEVLYRQPEIAQAVKNGRWIILVEGEKDAETLVSLGLDATTNRGGAGESWKEEYGRVLSGANVVVIPDADEPGRKHAEKFCTELKKVATTVKLLSLPGLPEGKKDVTDWIEAGHTRDELEKLVADAAGWKTGEVICEILDTLPDQIRRPLSLLRGRAYLATWIGLKAGNNCRVSLAIVRDDGRLYLRDGEGVAGGEPLSALDMPVSLKTAVEENLRWGGKALKEYIAGGRHDPAEAFDQLKQCADHFLDFGKRNFGSSEELAELISCFIISTYLLEAFPVTGYLWSTGFSGSGKTTLLQVACKVAYLGQMILASGTFAALRDMADYGATLCFDDAENLSDDRKTDPDKKALLLAGNHKGIVVPMKEPGANGTWNIRYVNAFCPRLFSAISLPDPVLSSRSILIPLVKSADMEKSKRDPAQDCDWPHLPAELRDRLYSIALANLPAMPWFDARATKRSALYGRDYQPWRAILGVALWLEEKCGVKGLFDRMHNLAVSYQTERAAIEEMSPSKLLVMALVRLFGGRQETIEFAPAEVADAMNTMADELELSKQGDTFTNAKKVGHLLQRLRIKRASRNPDAKKRIIPPEQLVDLAAAHNVPMTRADEPGPASETPNPDGKKSCRCADVADHAVLSDTPGDDKANGTTQSDGGVTCRSADHAVSVVLPDTLSGDLGNGIASSPPLAETDAAPKSAGNALDWEDGQ